MFGYSPKKNKFKIKILDFEHVKNYKKILKIHKKFTNKRYLANFKIFD